MPKFRQVLQEIEILNRRENLIQGGDKIVTGVSGGPDSTALLFLLSKLRRKYRLRLFAAHLDHGFLRKESARYLASVRRLCDRLNVPLYTKSVRLRALARKIKRSIEETGRMARYSFFEEVATKVRANKISTAHTLDDQAETVLLRILRGSGLRGLVGIPSRRPQGKFTVIRPLLATRKRDLVALLQENRISFCGDKTNRDIHFTRNRIRLRLLPRLEKHFNPQIKQSLANLQAVCADAQSFIDQAAERALRHCSVRVRFKKRVALKITSLKNLHPALLDEVLMKALAEAKGNAKRLTRNHMAAIRELVRSPVKNQETHLPGIKVGKKGAYLVIW